MLRHQQDIRSLLFVALAIGALAAPHLVAPLRHTLFHVPLAGVAWLAASGLLCFIASIINHNHMHSRMFSRHAWNTALNIALSVAKGHTATGIVVPHHLNHHVHAGAPLDWIKPALAGTGLGWARLARYVLASSLSMLQHRRASGAPQLPKRRRASQQMERACLITVVAAALWHDWQAFLVFDAAPWLVGLALLVAVNLLQHDGCQPGAPLHESRDFTGRLGNWLFFNNGYHSAHHWRPAAHWSELPALHARLTAGAQPRGDLQQPCLPAYVWKFGCSRTRQLHKQHATAPLPTGVQSGGQ